MALVFALGVAAPVRADGELDSSFANGGVLLTDLGDAAEAVAGVALADDGRFYVVADRPGTRGRDLVIAAFNSGGTPDASFGEEGLVVADVGGDERANAIAIDRSGRIVAMATRTRDGVQEIVLVRVLANGALDTSLGGTGRRVLTFTDGAQNIGGGLTHDLSGRILVAGTRTSAAGSVLAIARLLPDGALDTSLNSNGKRFVDFGVSNGTNASGAGIAVQDDGKIVAVGTRVGSGGSDFAVARLNVDGSFDTGFDGSGKTAIDFGATDVGSAVAIRPDGAIAVAGTRTNASGGDFAVAVLRPDGTLDPAFKGNGKATTDFGASETAYALVAQPDGNLLAVGVRDGGNGRDFAIARYRVDGSLDPALDDDGKLRVDLAPGRDDVATGVALLPDGRILAAGTSSAGGTTDLGVVRLRSPLTTPPGQLEIPSPGSRQSGIGLVSGWLCNAPGVTVRIDGQPAFATSYGTGRADTVPVCGNANTGFGLLFNWGLLGDGPHIIRAFTQGKQFASAVFEVQTLGTPFLRGASGTYELPGFPQAGKSVEIQWVEGLQRFVIRKMMTVTSVANATTAASSGGGAATQATVQGMLENPAPGSAQSGVGIISGWVCDASSVQVRIDGRPPLRAAYGTGRADTRAICGDANNGFGLLFNWGLLGDGTHTIEVRADGMPVGNASFTVTTLGTSFLRGASGRYTLPDFPSPGRTVDVAWDEGQQNFVVVALD